MRCELGPDTCRVCLEPSKRLQRIDESREEGEETPNEMLIQLLGISYSKLNGKDQVPDGICRGCKVELNMAYQFREKALRKQGEIEEYFREMGILDDADDVYVKEEVIGEKQEEELEEEEDDMQEFMYEDEAGVSKDDEYLEVDSNDQHETITGEEYLEENYIVVDPDQDEVVLESVASSASKSARGPRPVALTAAKYVGAKLRRGRGRKGTQVLDDGTEKGGYICDVCGNFYEKRGRMMEHRRRHDQIYQYQCELCDARFQVREQLRKHMYSHTGSKPYKCSFCSRQFFYESVLKAHENVHRGVKPYVCKVCDKAFAYAHSLSKHELIHTDIKLYHCEYCNKDFRLLHHMRQHEETKCHQNAVMLAETMKCGRDQDVEILCDDGHDDRNSHY